MTADEDSRGTSHIPESCSIVCVHKFFIFILLQKKRRWALGFSIFKCSGSVSQNLQ